MSERAAPASIQSDGWGFGWPGTIPDEMKAAFRANPLDPRFWFNLGALAHNNNDASRAARGFRRALLCDPTFASAQGHLAVLTAKHEGPITALALAKRLSNVVPTSAQNYALTTQYLFDLGRDARVAAMGRKSLVLDPAGVGVYRLMGLSASRLQKMAQAANLIRFALALNPDWIAARLALAGARFALEDFNAVLGELDQTLLRGGETSEGALLRGRALMALDRRDEAEESFAATMRLDPERRFEVDIARQTMDATLFG
jgi:tetratricopeptide (TPR) repeat protein